MIRLWLSAEETNVFDNALVVMEHLYKTGIIHIHLRHLLHEESFLRINYFIDKSQGRKFSEKENENIADTVNDGSNEEYKEESTIDKMKITLSMFDIDDHKRQLTFCNVDLPENMSHIKILLNEQLELLKLITNIYSTLIKLEMSGHPNYQLKNKQYKIYDSKSKTRTNKNKFVFSLLSCSTSIRSY